MGFYLLVVHSNLNVLNGYLLFVCCTVMYILYSKDFVGYRLIVYCIGSHRLFCVCIERCIFLTIRKKFVTLKIYSSHLFTCQNFKNSRAMLRNSFRRLLPCRHADIEVQVHLIYTLYIVSWSRPFSYGYCLVVGHLTQEKREHV